MENKKIPTISDDRIINTEISTAVLTKEDMRAKAFIKDREFTHRTSLRLPEKQWKKINKIALVKEISFNKVILDAISTYLEKEEITKILRKRIEY